MGRFSTKSLYFCAFLAVFTPVACLLVWPFHTLTHEFTTLFTVVNGLLFYFLAARLAGAGGGVLSPRSAAERHSLAVWTAAFFAAASGLWALCVLAGANRLFYHCDVWAGLPYFATTWPPAVFLAIVCGAALGAADVRSRMHWAALTVAVLVSAAHDGLQLYFGPRVYPVDFFLGDMAAFTQRGGMAPSGVHWRQRVFVVATTAFAFDFGQWRLGAKSFSGVAGLPLYPPLAGKRVLATGAALVLVAVFAGSDFGLGVGRANLHRAYPRVLNTEHYTIHYSDDPELLAELDALVRTSEWNWHYLTGLWDVEPLERVHLYLFETPADLEKYTGLANAHAGIGELFTDYESAAPWVLLHELTHALHIALNPHPLILLRRGMLEGIATAYEAPYTLLPEAHEFQAAALAAGKLPPAQSIMSNSGFTTNAEGAAYQSAGSFLGFLVQEYGFDKFVALQRSLDFEAIYEMPLPALDQEWRVFLSRVPVRSFVLLQASRFFDPDEFPAYYALECPKVGTAEDTLEDRAKSFWDQGDYEQAAALYETLYGERGGIEWARWTVRALEEQGRYGEALEALDTARAQGPLKDFEEAVLMAGRVRVLVKLRDWPALYEAYDERTGRGLVMSPGSFMGEQCLRHPDLREDYAALIVEENEYEQDRRWGELNARWPTFEPLAYLYAASGLSERAPLERRIDAALNAAGVSVELADLLGAKLMTLFHKAVAAREYTLAERICVTLLERCSDPRYRLAGEDGWRRLDFERGGRE